MAGGADHAIGRHAAFRTVYIFRGHMGSAEGAVIHQFMAAYRAELIYNIELGAAVGALASIGPLGLLCSLFLGGSLFGLVLFFC